MNLYKSDDQEILELKAKVEELEEQVRLLKLSQAQAE